MRIAIRRPLALGAVIAVSLLGATQASAGGPTSVLITNPGSSAAALYNTDTDYQVLLDALEPGGPAPDLGAGNPGPGSINITWLAHDVAIWRIDFVRLGSDGQMWVQTNTAPEDGSGGVNWGAGEWHTAADPTALRDVLERAGVLSPDLSTKAEPAADAKQDETPVESDSQDGSAGVSAGWWWLLPGAVVGLALGLGARPLATELVRRRQLGPRHQLIG